MISYLFLILSLVVILASLLAGRRRFAMAIAGLVLLTNAISAAIYYTAPEYSSVKAAVAAREAAIYLFFFVVFLLLKNLRIPVGTLVDRVFWLLMLMFAAFIAASLPRLGVSALLMGRQLIYPLAAYFLFRFLELDARQFRSVVNVILGIAVCVAVVALFEQVYVNWVDRSFWTDIQIFGYLAQKYGSFPPEIPGSWVNYMPTLVGLPPGIRSVSLMLDPLVAGHFLAGSLFLALFLKRGWTRLLVAGLLILGIVTTFSKASYLLVFAAVGGQALYLRHRGLRRALLGAVMLAVLVIGALIVTSGDDAFSHFGSFKAGLRALVEAPLGHGVGSTGYFTYLVTGGGALEAIDTVFSVYTYQMGVYGLAALFGLTVVPVLTLYGASRRGRPGRNNRLLHACLVLFAVYSILAFSSAAAFNAVEVFIPMMCLGVWSGQHVRARRQARLQVPTGSRTAPEPAQG